MNNRIKQVRTSLNLTQKDFAKKLGVTDTYVSLLESGNKEIGKQTKSLLINVFKVNQDWLETGNGEMFDPKPANPIDALSEISLLVELSRRSIDKLDVKTKETITTFITDLAAKLSEKDGKQEA